jgi:hypothetical protein
MTAIEQLREARQDLLLAEDICWHDSVRRKTWAAWHEAVKRFNRERGLTQTQRKA